MGVLTSEHHAQAFAFYESEMQAAEALMHDREQAIALAAHTSVGTAMEQHHMQSEAALQAQALRFRYEREETHRQYQHHLQSEKDATRAAALSELQHSQAQIASAASQYTIEALEVMRTESLAPGTSPRDDGDLGTV